MASLIVDRSIISFRLKVFWSVAKNLSFSKAAKELFISQPAISKHIRELEDEKGLCFFHRQGNQVSLTQAGKSLYAYTEQLISIYRRIELELEAFRFQAGQILSLGAGTTMAQYLVPTILSQFRKVHSQHKFSLVNGSSPEITQLVLNGELDCGIIEYKTLIPGLGYEPFKAEEVIAVINGENPHNLPSQLTLSQVLKHPLLFRKKGSGTRQHIEKELAKHQIKHEALHIRMEFESSESLKNFLLQDDSIGFLPEHAVKNELTSQRLKQITIPSFFPTREYHFIYKEGKVKDLVSAFIAFSKQVIT